jgi:hypothetical protein
MAEADGDDDAMAQHLDLARVYDSGELALELANEGVLIVETTRSAHLELHRFVDDGLRRVPRKVYDLAAGGRQLLEAGSYVVVATPADGGAVIRYPIRVERAKLLHLRLRFVSAAMKWCRRAKELGTLPDVAEQWVQQIGRTL